MPTINDNKLTSLQPELVHITVNATATEDFISIPYDANASLTSIVPQITLRDFFLFSSACHI